MREHEIGGLTRLFSNMDRSNLGFRHPHAVSPSIDNLLAVVQACGFELPLVLVRRDTSQDELLEEGRLASPERRVDRMLDRVKADAKKTARG